MCIVYKMASNVNVEMALLLVLLLRWRIRRMRASNRTIWTKNWIQKTVQGVYCNLIEELDAEDPEMFRQYHRLDMESFRIVLAMEGPLMTKEETIMHEGNNIIGSEQNLIFSKPCRSKIRRLKRWNAP